MSIHPRIYFPFPPLRFRLNKVVLPNALVQFHFTQLQASIFGYSHVQMFPILIQFAKFLSSIFLQIFTIFHVLSRLNSQDPLLVATSQRRSSRRRTVTPAPSPTPSRSSRWPKTTWAAEVRRQEAMSDRCLQLGLGIFHGKY